MSVLPALVRESLANLRARPWALSALGLASISSAAAICCGLGLVSVPFFLTEMLLVQLSFYGPMAPIGPRQRMLAMAVQLLGVLSVVAALLLSAIGGCGMDEPRGSDAATPERILPLWNVSCGLVMAFGMAALWLPLLHAPMLVLSGQAQGFAALPESARLFREHGVWLHIRLWLVVFALSWLPALAASALVYAFGLAGAWPLALMAFLGTLAISSPLGQGVLVAAYMRMRDPQPVALAPWPLGVRLIYSGLVAVPVMAAWLLLMSLWAPAPLANGPLQLLAEGQATVPVAGEARAHDEAPAQLYLQGSALVVTVSTAAVSVVASDGGGAGQLPLRDRAPVQRVRAVPVHDGFGIEVRQRAGAVSHTYIDHAGVRQDDRLRDRLSDRLPLRARLGWACAVLVLYLGTWPMLAQLGAAQRGAIPLTGMVRRARLRALMLAPVLGYLVFWPLFAWWRTWG